MSSDYKPYLTNEIFICTKHIGFTRSDIMSMPVWERRNYITQLLEEKEEEKKQMDKANSTSSSGGGKRTRRVST